MEKTFMILGTIDDEDDEFMQYYVAKELGGTDRIYVYDYYGFEMASKDTISHFEKQEAELSNLTEEDLTRIEKLVNSIKANAKNIGLSTKLLEKNLETLSIFLNNNEPSAYTVRGNHININCKHDKLHALAHELCHMEFSEVVVDEENKKVFLYSGLWTHVLDIDYVRHFDYDQNLIETKSQNSPINYGIDDFLNEARTQKIFNIKEVSDYPSFGDIIQTLLGEKTCQKARMLHDISLIEKGLLKIIPSETKAKELFKVLDNVFDKVNKDLAIKAEIEGYEILSEYINAFVEKKPVDEKTYETLTNWHVACKTSAEQISKIKETLIVPNFNTEITM
ncbi:MAG: hypothetical protein AB7S44_03550 [Spirochaetales bacterium]